MPSEASRQPDLQFKWALLNWNPHGHIPPGAYDKPHFDVQFYIQPIEEVFAIESGPCGPEHVRCDQFTQARLPVPANYMHADYDTAVGSRELQAPVALAYADRESHDHLGSVLHRHGRQGRRQGCA